MLLRSAKWLKKVIPFLPPALAEQVILSVLCVYVCVFVCLSVRLPSHLADKVNERTDGEEFKSPPSSLREAGDKNLGKHGGY